MAKPPVKHKVWLIEILIFVSLAIIVDVAQIVLDLVAVGVAVNRIIDIAFPCILLLWLFLTNRMNSRIIKLMIAAFVIEMIPILDVLPTWSAEVIYMIYLINSGKVKTYSRDELTHGGAEALAKETAEDMAKKPVPLPPGADKVPGMDKLEGAVGGRLGGMVKDVTNRTLENYKTQLTEEQGTSTQGNKGPTGIAAVPTADMPTQKSGVLAAAKQAVRSRIQNRGQGDDGVDEGGNMQRSGLPKANMPWNELYAQIKAQNPTQSDAWIRRKVELALAEQREVQREEEQREMRMKLSGRG